MRRTNWGILSCTSMDRLMVAKQKSKRIDLHPRF